MRFLLPLLFVAPAMAQTSPSIHAGDVELGVRMAAVQIDRSTHTDLGLRLGRFFSAHLFLEGELGYAHLLELDRLDLGLSAAWSFRTPEEHFHPYVGFGASLREEWIGSFQRSRWPVGPELGARFLVGSRALVRTELRLRWVQDEANETFLETQFALGIALRFPND